MYWSRFSWLCASALLLSSAGTFGADNYGASQCGSLENGFGPFDYRTAPADKRRLVEGAHFTRDVEQLIRGHTSSTPVGDLNYTLRVFPNHPRALYALMQWGTRKKPMPRAVQTGQSGAISIGPFVFNLMMAKYECSTDFTFSEREK